MVIPIRALQGIPINDPKNQRLFQHHYRYDTHKPFAQLDQLKNQRIAPLVSENVN